MFARKNINAVSHAEGSLKAARTSLAFRPDVDFDDGWPERLKDGRPWPCCCALSRRRRNRATFRSRGVRYDARSGESGITPHAMVETMMEGKPSIRNSNRHEAIGKFSPIHRIAQARNPANADASGAAAIRVRLLVYIYMQTLKPHRRALREVP